jgi:hypothetical protein
MQLGKQSVYNLIQKAIKNLKNSWVAGWVLAVVSTATVATAAASTAAVSIQNIFFS